MLCPVLYLLDVATDCNVAHKHFSQSNYLYFALTLLFILGPMLAEIIRNIYRKRRGYFRTWKEVFSLDSSRLLPRAWRSVTYAANSRREIDRDLCMLYEELNRLRADRLDGESQDRRRSKTSLINAHSFAAMVYNEGWQLLWKMHEALNESSPQLFLQLVIANMQLVDGEAVGLLTFIGILVSLASFSWTLHLCHYLGHYDGLKNNFKLLHRATDFVAHFVIVGCRFVVLSSVMALSPLWFSVVAFFYLGFRFIFLYYCSPDRGRYREITKESYNTLWMVYRLLITPYNLSVWCIDTYDDLFYHVETFVLALYWPFPLDCGHPLADYRWMITATILILNFILLPVLLKLNEAMFEKSPLCRDHDPFPIRLSIREDLKAGKTRVERLFGSTRGGHRLASRDQQSTLTKQRLEKCYDILSQFYNHREVQSCLFLI